MESDATWWLESPDGLEIGGSGLSARLRDYGRLGLFLFGGGRAGASRSCPRTGFARPRARSASGSAVDYGYMLWPISDAAGTVNEGAFEARGIFGQHIYVNPPKTW